MKRKNVKKAIPKPRNEFVAGMRFRKSGAHPVKSPKQIRKDTKYKLKKGEYE